MKNATLSCWLLVLLFASLLGCKEKESAPAQDAASPPVAPVASTADTAPAAAAPVKSIADTVITNPEADDRTVRKALVLELTSREGDVIQIRDAEAYDPANGISGTPSKTFSGLPIDMAGGEVEVPWEKITKVVLPDDDVKYEKGSTIYFKDGSSKIARIAVWLRGKADLGKYDTHILMLKQIIVIED